MQSRNLAARGRGSLSRARARARMKTGIALLGGLAAVGSAAVAQEGISIPEAVEAEWYVNPQHGIPIAGPMLRSENFIFSPDGSRALYLTRHGDLKTDDVVYRLYLVSYDPGAKPSISARELIAVPSGSNEPGISQIRWLDDRTVGFVGEYSGQPPQIFRLGLDGRAAKLTGGEGRKSGFAIGAEGEVLYGKVIPFEISAKEQKDGYIVGGRSLTDLVETNVDHWRNDIEYVLESGGRQRRIRSVSVPVSSIHPFISLSPSGRYAVVATAPELTPEEWRDLPLAAGVTPGAPVGSYHLMLVLVDLEKDEAYPISGAPMAVATGPNQLLWDEAGGRILVFDQFVTEAIGRTIPGLTAFGKPVSFAYSLEDKKPTGLIAVADETRYPQVEEVAIRSLNLSTDGKSVEVERRSGITRYAEAGRGWTIASQDASCGSCAGRRFSLKIEQGLDRPPQLYATPAGSAEAIKVGPELNAAIKARLIPGRLHEWTDKDGKTWQADLILPPERFGRKNLPLVIQTHSFYPDEFIITGLGGSSAAFAAQGLTKAGFAVLVVGTQGRGQLGADEEFARASEGYRSVIEDLAGKGLIDRKRVGAIAWSRSGFWLQHALAFQKDLFAAAIAADASSFGKFFYLFFHNWGGGYQRDYLTQNKVPPFGEGVDRWRQTDPVTRVPYFTVPLRIEHYGRSFPSWWESYAAMQEAKQPVEYYKLPEGQHAPVRPHQQLLIQNTTVDWFRFWLLGERNPAPLDAGQYERWSGLCTLRVAELQRSVGAAAAEAAPCRRAAR